MSIFPSPDLFSKCSLVTLLCGFVKWTVLVVLLWHCCNHFFSHGGHRSLKVLNFFCPNFQGLERPWIRYVPIKWLCNVEICGTLQSGCVKSAVAQNRKTTEVMRLTNWKVRREKLRLMNAADNQFAFHYYITYVAACFSMAAKYFGKGPWKSWTRVLESPWKVLELFPYKPMAILFSVSSPFKSRPITFLFSLTGQ